MATLETRVTRESDEYRANADYFRALLDELRDRQEQVRAGGGEAAVAKHRATRQAARARAHRALCAIPTRRSWSSARWRPGRCTTARRRPPGSSPASEWSRARSA